MTGANDTPGGGDELQRLRELVDRMPRIQGEPAWIGMTAYYPWSHDAFAGPHAVTVEGFDRNHVTIKFDDGTGAAVWYGDVFPTEEGAKRRKEQWRDRQLQDQW